VQVSRSGAVYKGPDTTEGYDFAGWLSLDMFRLAYWHRRLENCNYTDGKDLGDGLLDSQGFDCNEAKDSLSQLPLAGLPLFWMIDWDTTKPPGWDPEMSNVYDGPTAYSLLERINVKYCSGNSVCDDTDPTKNTYLQLGYEPQLGLALDLNLFLGLAYIYSPTKMHPSLESAGKIQLPLVFLRIALHLPGAINIGLSGLQTLPGVLNGLYFLFVGQCWISIVGGTACCLCGI